ncbi:MAG: hypothetical protein ACKV2U_16930 [Bryobacteraceae bacterium]
MAIPRSVHAQLVERLIFNFRFTPEALDQILPVTWLKPQVCNGWSVVSFCILDLERVMISPLPGAFGFRTTSCAYRCGVVDTSVNPSANSVYITDRQTDLPLIARLAPWLFLDTILMVAPKVTHSGNEMDVAVDYLDGQSMFHAKASIVSQWKSEVFPTLADFGDFIKGGVSSYTPSVYGDRLTRLDLQKDEPQYQALAADVDMARLDGVWRDAGVILDSAVLAAGRGNYKWTYRGLKPYTER